MSLVELGKSSGVVSLQGLFASNCPQAAASSSLTDIAEWVCRGGWPASKDRSLQAALYIPRQYLDAVIEDNAPRMGKNPAMTRRTIMSLARNNATAATMKTLIRDLYADDQAQDEEPARSTVSSYIQMLQREYLIEELPCWDAPIKAKNRMRVKPKRYFTDPSLAAAALGLTPTRLLTEARFSATCSRIWQFEICASTLRHGTARTSHRYRSIETKKVWKRTSSLNCLMDGGLPLKSSLAKTKYQKR